MLSKNMILASFSDLASKNFELLASLASALKILIPPLPFGSMYSHLGVVVQLSPHMVHWTLHKKFKFEYTLLYLFVISLGGLKSYRATSQHCSFVPLS
jgi:hypothetical protein